MLRIQASVMLAIEAAHSEKGGLMWGADEDERADLGVGTSDSDEDQENERPAKRCGARTM
jgi:hypothetical protein